MKKVIQKKGNSAPSHPILRVWTLRAMMQREECNPRQMVYKNVGIPTKNPILLVNRDLLRKSLPSHATGSCDALGIYIAA